jgi:hypothetical protein
MSVRYISVIVPCMGLRTLFLNVYIYSNDIRCKCSVTEKQTLEYACVPNLEYEHRGYSPLLSAFSVPQV